MPESLFENNMRLNRKAREFLLQAKEVPDPSRLYCLQLALWGTHNGLSVDYRVTESIPTFLEWPARRVMALLQEVNPNGREERLDLLEGQNAPLDLAWSVLDRLHDILSSKLGLTRD
jgi:hypothetical protein